MEKGEQRMSTSRLRAFGGTLGGACGMVLILAAVGGAANGDNFVVGVSTNSATAVTKLDTTASGGNAGLYVSDTGSPAYAILGSASGPGQNIGVYGFTNSSNAGSIGSFGALANTAPAVFSAAMAGVSSSATANGPGVWGSHGNTTGTAPGVLGQTSSTDANASGVYGTINSSADYAGGVRGENLNTSCCGFGVVGFHAGQGIGIGGYAPNGFGVFGWSPNNWAAYFDGAVEVVHDLHVNGTLFKAGGAFRIDNPLDPGHSYLQHSFVESPDMKNVYDGNVVTNAKGFATVTLPNWFQALNTDFRYQLTIVGTRGWRARVVKEIAHNQFTIQTDLPRAKVSWQVTGIRHDRYANANRIEVVVPKEGKADGTYLHPRLYGQPQSKAETALPGFARKMPKLKAPASPAFPKPR
jgi:hypothetical protein